MAPLNDLCEGSQPSSTPPYPTDGMRDDLYGKGLVPTHPDVAQSGSARALGAWGRRFESCRPDHYIEASLNGMTWDFDPQIAWFESSSLSHPPAEGFLPIDIRTYSPQVPA